MIITIINIIIAIAMAEGRRARDDRIDSYWYSIDVCNM